MTGMPYALEIGALFDAIADTYNVMDIAGRQAALHALYTEPDFIEVDYFPGDDKSQGGQSKTPFGKDMEDKFDVQPDKQQARVEHMRKDWLGKDGTGPTTGWWAAWRGDVEGIIRETLIRAVEVSLGYDHNVRGYHDKGSPGVRTKGTVSTLTQSPPPEWPPPERIRPLEFLWTCGSPRFDGWVYWRGDERDPVTVVFTTPGPLTKGGEHNMSLKLTEAGNPKVHNSDFYLEDPTVHTLSGVWVIGHEAAMPTKVFERPSFREFRDLTAIFEQKTATEVVVGEGQPIVVVRPSIFDGGIDPDLP